MQSCWLVALLLCNNWFFMLPLARVYFMFYRKKQTNIFFTLYHHIARQQMMATICTRTWALTIAICYLLIARSNDEDERIFHDVSQWASNDDYIFFMSYCKGTNDNTTIQTLQEARSWGMIRKCNNQIFIAVDCKKQRQWAYLYCIVREVMTMIFWCCKKWSYCKRACDNNKSAIARHKDATFICCWLQGWQQQAMLIARMTAMSVLVVLHEATMMMVDCGKGMQDCATQQLTNFLCCIARGASNYHKGTKCPRWNTSQGWQHHWCNDQFFTSCCIAKSFDANKILFSWVQEATTKVDHNSGVRKIA